MLEFTLNWTFCVCWKGARVNSVGVEQSSKENVQHRVTGFRAVPECTSIDA